MKKILSAYLISLFFCCFCFAEDYSSLFDKAKQEYMNGNNTEAIRIIKVIEKELSKIEQDNVNNEYEEVSFNQLKNFPTKYVGKKIKLPQVAISASNLTDTIIDGNYAIWVYTLNQANYFSNIFSKDKLSLVFVISEEIAQELVEYIPEGKVAYFEISTDKIYQYDSPSKYSWSTESTPVLLAEITCLESLNYNSYLNTTQKTDNIIKKNY